MDMQKYKKKVREYYEQLHANKFDNLQEMDKFLETFSPPHRIKKQLINWTNQSLEMKLNM